MISQKPSAARNRTFNCCCRFFFFEKLYSLIRQNELLARGNMCSRPDNQPEIGSNFKGTKTNFKCRGSNFKGGGAGVSPLRVLQGMPSPIICFGRVLMDDPISN